MTLTMCRTLEEAFCANNVSITTNQEAVDPASTYEYNFVHMTQTRYSEVSEGCLTWRNMRDPPCCCPGGTASAQTEGEHREHCCQPDEGNTEGARICYGFLFTEAGLAETGIFVRHTALLLLDSEVAAWRRTSRAFKAELQPAHDFRRLRSAFWRDGFTRMPDIPGRVLLTRTKQVSVYAASSRQGSVRTASQARKVCHAPAESTVVRLRLEVAGLAEALRMELRHAASAVASVQWWHLGWSRG